MSSLITGIEYSISFPNSGEYLIDVRTLPTHANQYNDQIRLQLDGKHLGSAQLNTKGRSDEWKTNVLRNSQIKTFNVNITDRGTHTLRIAVNQTGIVFDQMLVYPADVPMPYE